MSQTSERKVIVTDLELHMEDAIELAALEDDKESRIWWSMVEDLIEVTRFYLFLDISVLESKAPDMMRVYWID